MTVDQDWITLAGHYITKARDRYDDGLVLKNMDRYEILRICYRLSDK